MNQVDRTYYQFRVMAAMLARGRYRCRTCKKRIRMRTWHSAGHAVERWERDHAGHADRG